MDVKGKIEELQRDDVIAYPDPENSGQPIKDKIFNWVVQKYKKKNLPWRKSDQRVFHGFIYGALQYLGYVAFFAIMYWMLGIVQKNSGFERALIVVLLIILVRLNVIIQQFVRLNKKF
jgi:hypothetical protein